MSSFPRTSCSGVGYNSPDGQLAYIPLTKVVVKALIIDVSARVTLTQVFYNPNDDATSRAKYVFPLPARAAVCAFEMLCDGKIIRGISKEADRAREEHELAAQAGKLTSLVQRASDDLFTISLGSIPAKKTVVTTLTYVMDLLTGDYADHVLFQIPMSICQRYGTTPAVMVGAEEAKGKTRIAIRINIQTSGPVREISSPSHPSAIIKHYTTHRRTMSLRRKTVEFSSTKYLKGDFVLTIRADGLDVPRCFAEHNPRGAGTVAMQLTMVPKLLLPPITEQEYIFLIDRSSSMQGHSIDIAKKTLVLLLHLLPRRGTTFNIFSFGNKTDSMYSGSQAYMKLHDATKQIERMDADYGGTKICNALRVTLGACSQRIPTSVFLLTDGGVGENECTIAAQIVREAVGRALAGLRIFTLGIGAEVSTDLCERIANASGGVFLLASDAETILPKCTKLLRAGKTTVLQDVTINWGVTADPLLANRGGSSGVRFTDHDTVLRQAPSVVGSIYHDYRSTIFALINDESFTIPRSVTLTGRKGERGEVETIEVPVEHVKFTSEEPRIPLIHTLAAKRLITELQGNLQDPPREQDPIKSSIIRLGEQYQLVSKFTSFVAVDGERTEPWDGNRGRRYAPTRFPRVQRISRSPSPNNPNEPGPTVNPPPVPVPAPETDSFMNSVIGYSTSFLTSIFQYLSNSYQGATTHGPGGHSQASDPRHAPSVESLRGSSLEEEEEENEEGHETDRTFSTLSSLEPHSDSDSDSDWYDSDLDRHSLRPPSPTRPRSPSPHFPNLDEHPQPTGHGSGGDLDTATLPYDVLLNVCELVKLQSSDGSFALDPALGKVIGMAAIHESVRPPGIELKVWATVLAVAFLRKYLASQPELLEGLLQNAMEFVSEHCEDVDFGALLNQAEAHIN